ncbi:MAG: TSUP family transporter [Desulfovibrio sp.]|nr:TSUP family transporter [Desulfovibrio sp.]
MLTISASCAIICAAAAFAGGFIDAISGGGALLTIPALLLTGVPPHLALGTNKIGACMGTIVSLANFGRHGLVAWRLAAWGIAFSFAGSWAGSLTALYIDAALLGKIIVALLPAALLATLLPSKKNQAEHADPTGGRFWLAVPILCLFVGFYDGFFGPGTGSILILLLHWIVGMSLIRASGTAKALNLASNFSAAVSFIWHGTVIWSLGLIMGCCFMAGNWLGSALAIRAGSKAVRRFLILSLVLLMASLVWQYFIAPLLGN